MENEKAIEIFNKWMDCKDAYQADPSCDGNCFSCEYYASAEEEKEAMLLAISALEKQEQDRWIPVTERLPEYEKEVLTCDDSGGMSVGYLYSPGFGHADRWHVDFTYSPVYHIVAWRPLPEAFQGE